MSISVPASSFSPVTVTSAPTPAPTTPAKPFQPWLNAWTDPVANLHSFSPCLRLADIAADGDHRLLVAGEKELAGTEMDIVAEVRCQLERCSTVTVSTEEEEGMSLSRVAQSEVWCSDYRQADSARLPLHMLRHQYRSISSATETRTDCGDGWMERGSNATRGRQDSRLSRHSKPVLSDGCQNVMVVSLVQVESGREDK